MDQGELQELLPDIDRDALQRASDMPNVRAAVKDLELTLKQLARCESDARDQSDWEETRDELLAEIKRLVLRQAERRW